MQSSRTWFTLSCLSTTLLYACSPASETAEVLVKTPVAPQAAPDQAQTAPVTEASSAATDGVVRLTWTGCGVSKKAYMAECVAEYMRSTAVEVIVTGGGATRGIRATAGGTADMGGTCRHALGARFPSQEADATLTHVAWDALVFFTHIDNPVEGISSDQARRILLGDTTSWSELGGPDIPIQPVFRQQTVIGKLSGVGYMTRLLLFSDSEVDFTDHAIFFPSSEPLEEYVEATPYTLAVTGVSSAKKRNVKILALDGVHATRDNIATGAYPLFRPLYLATPREPKGATLDFVAWLVGEAGQAVLSRAGTVSLAEGRALNARYRHWPDSGVVREL